MAQFAFSEWKKKFPADVGTTLEESGINTYEVLIHTTSDDLATLDLKRGHLIAVRTAIAELRQEAVGTPSAMTATTAAAASTTALDDLLGSRGDGGGVPVGGGAGRVDLDPTAFLNTRRPGEPALRIVDFINTCNWQQEQEVELGGGVAIRLPRQKPRLDSVSPAQWIAANARIMATMLETGRLSASGTMDYLAYTAKVGEMAARYSWTSVLLYDDQYRQNQAAYNFRWGSDSQHLALVALRERTTDDRGKRPPPPRTKHPQAGVVGRSGKQICQQWNRGRCHFEPNCQFEHACSVCLRSDHCASKHHPPNPSGGQHVSASASGGPSV